MDLGGTGRVRRALRRVAIGLLSDVLHLIDRLQLLWRTLTQFHTFCEIEFMPVYHPSEEEKKDPKLYARNVRNLMAQELGIPVSDYTFDDCKLMTFVKNVNMPYAAFSTDIDKLRKELG